MTNNFINHHAFIKIFSVFCFKKYEIPPLTVDQESVLGDLNELLDLDVDSGTLESEGAEETIENLTKTINLLEESARYIVENE